MLENPFENSKKSSCRNDPRPCIVFFSQLDRSHGIQQLRTAERWRWEHMEGITWEMIGFYLEFIGL